ncbi:MAG: polyprenol monophosphomannose synthase [Bacteroidia bacterium]|nr:polyprenol monophosphomannose synthase [Bacteroidia bacterium]
MSESIVIIPTYNEKENIEKIIQAVIHQEEPFHVLIVDDGSPDGTADIVKRLQGIHPEEIHLLERSSKQGLGTAYIAGFKYCLQKGYTYIFEMDADFSHNPLDLPRLLKACRDEGGDFSIGSRYVRGGKVSNWSWDRIILSYGASWYVRLLTWMWIKDPTAGFICYTSKVLEAIDFDKIEFVGYAFQIEMKFAARQLGFKHKEVPITFSDREEGVSKMNGGIISEAVIGVLKMCWRGITGFYRN